MSGCDALMRLRAAMKEAQDYGFARVHQAVGHSDFIQNSAKISAMNNSPMRPHGAILACGNKPLNA